MTSPIECIPVDLSDEQRANLAKLAAYLWTLPADYPDFEMSSFTNDEERGDYKAQAYVATCGTAACACGHGPVAGILPESGETWPAYSYRAFIPRLSPDPRPWDWCFGADWSDVDNTVHGAAARIEFMLKHGCPENSADQEMGEEPLCYTTDRSQVQA